MGFGSKCRRRDQEAAAKGVAVTGLGAQSTDPRIAHNARNKKRKKERRDQEVAEVGGRVKQSTRGGQGRGRRTANEHPREFISLYKVTLEREKH